MKRILIANRGEIAIRIAKAVRELGHVAVGLWTDNEVEAPHLEYCHEWIHLTGKSNKETYLNMDALIEIIQKNKIDAVHPGYGFLSENYNFSKKLQEIGCLFIGPHPAAIDSMGDKAKSKVLAKKAGVPVVPGSAQEVKSIEEAIQIALEIKYPVLLKAVAGGGGKGMRVCHNEEELKVNFERVASEALNSFGNAGLLVEKFILNPHHIEVQIIADNFGNVLHCFERECSIQRRHQKIIEESPSPFIGSDSHLRKNICETAVTLAKAVNYNSAGTVEFIMGEDKAFYFLEMNTRIQVEHPITEEVTGVDLMTLMIQSGLGEKLTLEQTDISQHGHSIECRICAEDPVSMLPAPGFVTGLEFTFAQGTRFDHCLFEGYHVTPDFDPMVGKLIVKGFNRDIALRKMRESLNGLKIEGLKNNIPLLKEILKEKNFVMGHYTTNYIYEVKPFEMIQDNHEERLSLYTLARENFYLEQKL